MDPSDDPANPFDSESPSAAPDEGEQPDEADRGTTEARTDAAPGGRDELSPGGSLARGEEPVEPNEPG